MDVYVSGSVGDEAGSISTELSDTERGSAVTVNSTVPADTEKVPSEASEEADAIPSASTPAADSATAAAADGEGADGDGAATAATAADVDSAPPPEGADDADCATADAFEAEGPTVLQLLHAATFTSAVEQPDGRCVIPVSNMPSVLGSCNVVVESLAFSLGSLSVRHIWIPLLALSHATDLTAACLLRLMATAGRLPYMALEVKGGHVAVCAKLPAFLPPDLLQMSISVLILTADTLVSNEPDLAAAITASRS